MMMSVKLWTAEERQVILTLAEGVFFRAMIDGYVGGKGQKSTKVTTPDGRTIITYIEGPFRVVDEYWTTPQSDASTGATTIIFSQILHGVFVETPVWGMGYGGRYPKEVIPFLKSALATAYRRHEFCGGRGPERYIEEGLTYENHSRQGVELDSIGSSFTGFQGHEEIGVTGGKTLGFHHYFGMAMI
jgi:hypothetical protein